MSRSVAILLLVALVGIVLLAGCGGGGTARFILPPEMVGLWGAVAFDNAGNPVTGALFRVDENGTITLVSDESATFAGQILNETGAFSAQFNTGIPTPVTVTGDLDTNDTGTGTWHQGTAEGTVQLWRAGTGESAILDVTVEGPFTGGGVVDFVNGEVAGTITIEGVGTSEIHGVVTSAGHIVGGWGGGGGLPFVFFEGDHVDGTIGGTWTADDGTTGTWTATSVV